MGKQVRPKWDPTKTPQENLDGGALPIGGGEAPSSGGVFGGIEAGGHMVTKAERGVGLLDPVKQDNSTSLEQAKKARDAYQTFMDERGNVKQYDPGQVVAPTIRDPQEFTAATVGANERIEAPDLAKPQTVSGGVPVSLGQIAPVERIGGVDRSITAAQSGPAAQAAAQYMGRAQLDTTQADQTRSQQQGALGLLQGAAEGKAPSVAELALKQKIGEISQQQLGQAAQAKGTDRLAAKRAAMYNIANEQGKGATSMAMARAQEMANARGQYAGALTDVRGADVSTAAQNAQLIQGQNQTNAQIGTQTSEFNAGETNTGKRFDTGQQNTVLQGNQQVKLTADTTDANAGNTRADTQQARQLAMDTANKDRDIAIQQYNAGTINKQQLDEATFKYNAAVQNAGNTLARNTTQANLEQGASAANTGAVNRTSELNAGMNLTGQQLNQGANLTAHGQLVSEKTGLAGAAAGAMGAANTATGTAAAIDAQNVASQNRSDSALASTIATAGTSYLTAGKIPGAPGAPSTPNLSKPFPGEDVGVTQHALTADQGPTTAPPGSTVGGDGIRRDSYGNAYENQAAPQRAQQAVGATTQQTQALAPQAPPAQPSAPPAQQYSQAAMGPPKAQGAQQYAAATAPPQPKPVDPAEEPSKAAARQMAQQYKAASGANNAASGAKAYNQAAGSV